MSPTLFCESTEYIDDDISDIFLRSILPVLFRRNTETVSSSKRKSISRLQSENFDEIVAKIDFKRFKLHQEKLKQKTQRLKQTINHIQETLFQSEKNNFEDDQAQNSVSRKVKVFNRIFFDLDCKKHFSA